MRLTLLAASLATVPCAAQNGTSANVARYLRAV